MTAQTSAGTTLAITSSLPATNDAAGFGALSFTTIGEVTDLGEFGRVYNLVTHTPLDDRQTRKFKGSFDDGSVTVQLAYDIADAGQVLIESALASDANYSFKVTLQDGTIFYFQAKVMSQTTAVSSVDTITGSNVQIEISEAIVRA